MSDEQARWAFIAHLSSFIATSRRLFPELLESGFLQVNRLPLRDEEVLAHEVVDENGQLLAADRRLTVAGRRRAQVIGSQAVAGWIAHLARLPPITR